MIPKIQFQLLQKTISTIPTLHEIASPSIHNYHQYETLLFYITSFITDFKLHIVELKQLVYQFAGVNLNYYNNQHHLIFDNCEQCQVEYMMNSCRKARQDIVRVLAILRGLHRNQQFKQETFDPRFIYPQNQAIISRIKEKLDSSSIIQKKKYEDNIHVDGDQIGGGNYQNISLLGNNQIGFLTFRQIKISQDRNKISKIWSQQFKIQEQINQTSRSHVSMRASAKNQFQNYQQTNEIKNNSQGNQINQINQRNFNRAFQLFKLIKQQINKPASSPDFEQLSVNNKISKDFDEKTPSPTMDSPFKLDITDL